MKEAPTWGLVEDFTDDQFGGSKKKNMQPYGCFQKYGKTPKSSILIGFSMKKPSILG